ncbi:coiled-coil domain-containing protein 110 isoform X3 [Numida meleagris]|uniref:coiled-coil domain-containing protein 110 isoform X3 n=1 Tax=Numida meleagris TaxID=8996 RepID=UPI000B3DA9A6|nr:coiled-coil domain-containing protein 110 isoform X3 [Numida meleagris]
MGESARPRPSAGMPGWPRGWAGRPSRRAMLRGHRGNHTIEAEDPIHLQTALEILQQQLESFQTFQKQTLENANMVQFEISDIVNQNIFEMKTPVHISAKIMTTAHISCTATNASLTLLRRGDQKFSENKLAPEYDGEIEALHKSLKNSEHVQKRVHYLQNENLTLRNNVKSLADTIQSLKEKISKYNMKIKDLAKEKRSMQIQLVKLPEGNEECVKEVKNLLRKCKELQNQKIILEKEKNQHHNGNKDTIQALHDFQIRNKKSEEKMTAGSCEKGRLNVTLESLKHKCSNSQETNKKLDIKIRQFTEEKSSLEQEFEGNQSEIQQMKEKETAPKSELETPLQLMQTLPEEKLNLEMTLQECSNTKQMLLKDINKVQSDKVYTEKKLMTELRNTKADIDLLKYNLTTANTEYKRLSKVITDIAEENQLLKKELNEYRQYASKYENDIRKLTEECLLLENHLQTIENERDVLQLEFRRLHKNFVYLQGQATSLAWAQKKPYSSSGIMENNCYSEHSTRTCKEIPDLEYLSQGNEKITKIRKKIQEEELKRWKEK